MARSSGAPGQQWRRVGRATARLGPSRIPPELCGTSGRVFPLRAGSAAQTDGCTGRLAAQIPVLQILEFKKIFSQIFK